MLKHKIYNFIIKYRPLSLVLVSIFFLFIICWIIKFSSDFIVYYLKIFNASSNESKLTAMSTVASFIVGEFLSIMFISFQISSSFKNIIYSKKYDSMSSVIDNVNKIDNAIYDLSTQREDLRRSMYRVISKNPIKVDYRLLKNKNEIHERLNKYIETSNNIIWMVKDALNIIDKDNIKYVDRTVSALNELGSSLSSIGLYGAFLMLSIGIMQRDLKKIKGSLSQQQQNNMYGQLKTIKGQLYPKENFMKCQRELNASMKDFKKAKSMNK